MLPLLKLQHKPHLQNTDLENVHDIQLLVLKPITSITVKHSKCSGKAWKSCLKKSLEKVEEQKQFS